MSAPDRGWKKGSGLRCPPVLPWFVHQLICSRFGRLPFTAAIKKRNYGRYSAMCLHMEPNAHKIGDAESGQDFSNSYRAEMAQIYFERLKIGDALDYFLIWRHISRVSIVCEVINLAEIK